MDILIERDRNNNSCAYERKTYTRLSVGMRSGKHDAVWFIVNVENRHSSVSFLEVSMYLEV